MSEYKLCSRCVMDTSDESIHFDENGYCNYCNDVLRRRSSEYFPNAQGKKKLDELMTRIKNECRDDKYDCMVGISGGLDSSYVLYIGHQYGLRMLGVHIDDGLDTTVAKNNIRKLCEATGTEMISVRPDMEQYRDVTRSLFIARVPNLAIAQDNILLKALKDTAEKYKMRYSLSGANFAMESILQRGNDPVNASDKKHITAIHKRFGEGKIDKLNFISITERYIFNRYVSRCTTCLPLNYIDYNLKNTLEVLDDFCGYEYYGGKHYESILTRFLQCWYLPNKYNFDKRKSHYSSLIIDGQMDREQALKMLEKSAYTSDELRASDFHTLAEFIHMTDDQFEVLLRQPPLRESDYPVSWLNSLAPIARRFRIMLG